MSLDSTRNLIDLSIEEEVKAQRVPLIPANHKTAIEQQRADTILVSKDARNSLDNNPFDKALKQASLLNDPFEAIAREAEETFIPPNMTEVRTGNLLGLNENMENCREAETTIISNKNYLPIPVNTRLESTNSNPISSASSISSVNSSTFFGSDFNPNISSILRDSLPKDDISSSLGLNKAILIDSSASVLSHSDKTNNSSVMNNAFVCNPYETSLVFDSPENINLTKKSSLIGGTYRNKINSESSVNEMLNNKNKEKSRTASLDGISTNTSLRNQLLKFSLSNSTYNSPLRHCSKNSEDMELSVFSEARSLAEQFSHVAMSISPKISEDSCDDIMAIKPNWVDSETDIDDLELLKIPMLQEIDKQEKETSPVPVIEKVELMNEQNENKSTNVKKEIDIKSLKEKIERGKSAAFNRDLDDLISNLKMKVNECQDQQKQSEANNLLESLSNILKKKTCENKEEIPSGDHLLVPPQPIIRQDTFDLDRPNVQSNQSKADIVPQISNNETSTKPAMLNVSVNVESIVQQVSQLLNREQLDVVQANLPNMSTNCNPTYIVVMGTPKFSNQICQLSNGDSPEFEIQMRPRRSNSLSLHNKPSKVSDVQEKAISDQHNGHFYNTPIRSTLSRRNSICGTPTAKVGARRSIYGSTERQTPSSALNKQNIRDQKADKQFLLKNASKLQSDFNTKKLKLKNNELISKPQGPLKATVPLKKITPMIVTPSVTSPIDNLEKKKPITSTPVVVNNSLKAYPLACSTPSLGNRRNSVTPIAKQISSKSRLSYISATPNPRSNTGVPAFQNRRRSLTQTKLDLKTNESIKETLISKPQHRTLKLPEECSKPLDKSEIKLSVKFQKNRISTQNRNKENKK